MTLKEIEEEAALARLPNGGFNWHKIRWEVLTAWVNHCIAANAAQDLLHLDVESLKQEFEARFQGSAVGPRGSSFQIRETYEVRRGDKELAALAVILEAMDRHLGDDPDAKRRVLEYLARREEGALAKPLRTQR